TDICEGAQHGRRGGPRVPAVLRHEDPDVCGEGPRLRTEVLALAEACNAFVHYKWNPAPGDSPGARDEASRKTMARAEALVSDLTAFVDAEIYGGSGLETLPARDEEASRVGRPDGTHPTPRARACSARTRALSSGSGPTASMPGATMCTGIWWSRTLQDPAETSSAVVKPGGDQRERLHVLHRHGVTHCLAHKWAIPFWLSPGTRAGHRRGGRAWARSKPPYE